jgi:hypothetical protein
MSQDESNPDEASRELEATDKGEAKRPEDALSRNYEVSRASAGELVPTEPLGLLDKFKLATLQSRKELEAVSIVLDARIEQMRHQAEAASRESKTYWDAKSAEVVSAMKTFVQAQLRGIENERMASRLDSLKSAYEMFASKVREVETGSLPEEMRESLIRKMHENLTETIERLEKDAIADKYDLKD